MNNVKRHVGTGKIVKKSEFVSSKKVKVTYTDLSSEEMSRKDYQLIIREVKS